MKLQLRHLQHYVAMIMFSSAFVLSTLFSFIAYHLNQQFAVEESEREVRTLIAAVKNTASAALFSANEAVGWDAVNGLLGTDVVYSVMLEGYPNEFNAGMELFSTHENGGSPLTEIAIELDSIFDPDQTLGVLKVAPNASWVANRARDTSIPVILGVIIVIFVSCAVSTHALRLKISEPLVKVRRKLKRIHADSPERLYLPEHLRPNEIGVLVDGFNELLDETNAAFSIERRLRKQMQVVQENLQVAKADAELAAQAKSDFLATMSHEIRTPLSGVLGMLGFALKDPELTPATREHIEIGMSNAEALLTIINDILDLSKIEAGKLTVEAIDFDIRKQLKAALAVFPEMAASKSLCFDLDIAADMPPFLIGDPTRIRQVLVNFVGNAIKFTEVGKVQVVVSQTPTTPNDDSRPLIRFAVKDTGIGLSDEAIPKLFQKFEQADVSTTRKFGGTGLGLAISKQLIEAMGGEVSVSSELGKGSTFQFEIPMAVGEGLDCDGEEQELQPHTHKLHILCAEDFETNQLIIKTMLENMGHDVEIVENGKLALNKLLESEFDLVLMDGRMPEMDGIDATRQIRRGEWHNQKLANADIKVIALTANVTDEDRRRYLDAGMDDFLRKPIDEPSLHKTIEQTISELLAQGVSLHPLIRASTNELDSLFAIPSSVDQETAVLHDSPADTVAMSNEDTLAEKLRAAFVESLPERIMEMTSALEQQNFEELGRLFHGIKGSAGYLKDDVLVDVAGKLEQWADNQQMNEIEISFADFLQNLETYQTTR